MVLRGFFTYDFRMLCTLFSVSETELLEATGELPSYADGDSLQAIATSPVGLVLELGKTWRELHTLLGAHEEDHPLAFLTRGGEPAPSMITAKASGRCFKPSATIELLAWVARLDDTRVRKLRQFLADAVLARHGIIVHHFE